MQSFLEGKPTYTTWFEDLADTDGDADKFETNDPLDQLEAKHVTFPSSLAMTMAELRHLQSMSLECCT
jgi:hypothetical protein